MRGYEPIPTDDYMTEIRVEGDLGGLLNAISRAATDGRSARVSKADIDALIAAPPGTHLGWCPQCHQTIGHDEDCPNRHW